MVTDEERVSAKTKLRVAQAGLERGITDGELIDCLAEAVGFDSVSTERYEAGLLGRIADLIGGRSDLDAIMLPLDADGAPIRLGDEVYGKASIPLKVGEIRFRAYDEAVIVASAIEDGVRSTIAREGDFWRHEPDSWQTLVDLIEDGMAHQRERKAPAVKDKLPLEMLAEQMETLGIGGFAYKPSDMVEAAKTIRRALDG